MRLTRRQKYERKTVHALRYYASALGLHPVDVAQYLGRRVSVHQLNKAALVELHLKLDRAKRGLGRHLS